MSMVNIRSTSTPENNTLSHVAHEGRALWRDFALFAFVGMAVFVPIALLVDSDDVTIVKGPLFSLLVAAAVFIWLWRSIGQQQLRFVAMAYQLPLAAFLVLALLSSLWSDAPDASLSGGITLSYYVLACLLLVSLLEYRQARIVIAMTLATGACVASYGLLQAAGIDVISWGTDFATSEGTARVFATMGHPNFLGSYMILIFSLATARAVTESTFLTRGATAIIAVLSGACLLATLSRGAWVGCSVSCIVIAAYQGRGWLTPRRIVGICIIAALAAVIVSGRLVSSQNMPARMALWESAIDMIIVAPIWGHGYSSFATIFPTFRPADYWLRGIELTVGHAHNEMLESTVELGIVGLLLLLWCTVSFFRSVNRSIVEDRTPVQRSLLIGLTAGIVGMLVHSLLDVGLRWPAVAVPFWLSVGLASVLSARAGGQHFAKGVREFLLPLNSIGPGFRWVSAAAGVVVVGYVAVQGARQVMADRMLLVGTQASSRNDWPSSAAAFEDALAYEPDHVGALYKLSAAHIKNGEPARALKVLGRLEELSPGYAELDRNTGLAHIQLGNMPMAVRRYETAARLDSVPPNWFDLGQVYELNGQKSEAVRAYETYLPLATTYILQHEERAARLAVAHFESDSIRERKLVSTTYQRARIAAGYLMEHYVAEGNWHRARATFEPWLAAHPHDSQVQYFLGYSLQQQGDLNGAILAYEATIAMDDTHAPAMNNLGVIYTTQKARLNTAIDLIKRALELSPQESPHYLDSLGWAYFMQGDHRNAITALLAGVAACPDDNTVAMTELLYHLGLVYENEGDVKKAKTSLMRARELAVGTPMASKVVDALTRIGNK